MALAHFGAEMSQVGLVSISTLTKPTFCHFAKAVPIPQKPPSPPPQLLQLLFQHGG